MNADLYQRSCDLFLKVCELPANEQAAFLIAVCGNDDELHQQVERMLIEDQQAGLVEPTEAIRDLLQSSVHGEFTTHNAGRSETPLQPDPKSLPEVAGFTVTERLGKGGMGIVYRAIQHSTHRAVALKAVRHWQFASEECHRRFLLEVKLAASLEHPNIARIYDSGQTDGMPWLAMELVDGCDLDVWVQTSSPEERTLVNLMASVCDALAYAHRRGIIHRDLKPGNILVTSDGKPFVVDFGLARMLESDDHSGSRHTVAGALLGTPGYMSPEQARGDSQATDVRSDCYSLGSILFWLLTARHPHDLTGSLLTVMKRVAEEEPNSPQSLNRPLDGNLEAVVMKAVSKQPEDRYQTADGMAADLRRYLNGEPPIATCDSNQLLRQSRLQQLRHQPWLTISGLLILMAVAVVVVAILPAWRGAPSRDRFMSETLPTKSNTSDNPTAEPATMDRSAWHGWPSDAPAPAIAPFDAAAAKQHQEAWAKYLSVPVEYTNSIGMKFRLIPPGKFLMGSTREEIEEALKAIGENNKRWREYVRSEGPQHRVTLTRPIYFGVYEVTQAEYEKVMGENPSCFARTGQDERWVGKVEGLDTSDHPVENVSWNDAADFCARLSQQEERKPFYIRSGETIKALDGTGYRLPSEAEWEFACRAGTTTKYWIGDRDEELMKAGWFPANSESRTHVVGELKANPFGLYDIHGNVWEWVQDWWEANYYSQFNDQPAVNPSGPSVDRSGRGLRGGNWADSVNDCRAANRPAYIPTGHYANFGFRVTLVVAGPPERR